MGAKKIDEAQKMLEDIPTALVNKPEILALQAQIDLTNQTQGLGEINDLREALKNDLDNHQIRFDLALALFTAGETNDAIQELLTILEKIRNGMMMQPVSNCLNFLIYWVAMIQLH